MAVFDPRVAHLAYLEWIFSLVLNFGKSRLWRNAACGELLRAARAAGAGRAPVRPERKWSGTEMDGDFGDMVKAWPKRFMAGKPMVGAAPNALRAGALRPGGLALGADALAEGSTGTAPLPPFPKAVRNKVRRYPARGSYERPDIYRTLDAALLCHVAYIIDGQPYCTPTSFWREDDRLFWHGSSASRMLRSQAQAIPACLTVCHLDGIVLARAAFHHSINYRSVMAFGTAEIVDTPEAKDAALRAFVNRYFPGRWETAKPPTPQEVKGTTIISMRIEEASAKTRSGPPVDDEADYALPVWAGVIPLQTLVGEAQDCPRQHKEARRGRGLSVYRKGRRLDEVLAEAQLASEAEKAEEAERAARAARRQLSGRAAGPRRAVLQKG